MKFVADRVDVLAALAKCGIASEDKSPHPNYRTCFITSDGKNRVVCHAMNEHLSVRVGFPAGVTETGKMTVNTKKFTELVSMLPEGRVEFANKGAKETEKQVLKSLVAKRQYTLVGQDEADMKFNRISIQSPVGRALIGKRVGDFIEVKTPVKIVEYEVVEIKFEEF